MCPGLARGFSLWGEGCNLHLLYTSCDVCVCVGPSLCLEGWQISRSWSMMVLVEHGKGKRERKSVVSEFLAAAGQECCGFLPQTSSSPPSGLCHSCPVNSNKSEQTEIIEW